MTRDYSSGRPPRREWLHSQNEKEGTIEVYRAGIGWVAEPDEVITSRLWAPIVQEAAASGSVTTSGTTEVDCTDAAVIVTPAIASVALVWATFDLFGATVAGDTFIGILDIDGTNATQNAVYIAVDTTARLTLGQHWLVTLAAGAHTLKLQIARTAGTGTISAAVTHTKIACLVMGDANSLQWGGV